MTKRLEIGRNPIGVEVAAREQRDLVTSHVLAIQNRFDAKVAEKIGFGGNILEEANRARLEGRDLASPLQKYTRKDSGDFYISNEQGEEKFIYSLHHYEDGIRVVRFEIEGMETKLSFDKDNRLISMNSKRADRKMDVDLKSQFPIRLTRGEGDLTASAEYNAIDEDGNFTLAEGGNVNATFSFNGESHGAAVTYSPRERAVIDWGKGLEPFISMEGDNLAIREEDDGSKPYTLPLRGNIYNEL